ncbi:RTA1 domain protein [Cordyceps fumosorosea ARSEF 2679]|uniref:RTA1 domain protein n=1 Tax=Cordyceps fumosorosea (strain ARSEF 2679) TaxID=1081104 RepID=A0A167TP20_CORFA|nr:RTA1 domain protein [Cordyceps fumosorosea ARSEF 2679]OAA60798.1 RTA1 domain protein [Cordyceps fumosorosea ARSEF 2679]
MATPTTYTHTPTTSSTASPSCTTAVPDKYGHVPFDACNSNYNDNPSFEANLAFAVVFGASFVTHIVQAIVYKKRFCWVVIMGAAWETAAFSLRTIGSHNQQERQYAIWGTLLFLLAPLWINAFAYMTVARMVYFGLPDKKIWGVRAVKLTVLFVWLDIICFLVQLGGGGLLSNNDNANLTRIGMKLYTAGIGLQLGFIVIFGVMTAWFYHRMRQVSRGQGMGRLRFLIWVMLAVLVLIMMRIIYRLLEFGPGINADNKLITDETYPLTLDAMPMALALGLLNLFHPGLVLRGSDGEFPRVTRKEKKAIKQQAKEEKKRQKEAKKARKAGKFVYVDDMTRLADETDGDVNGHAGNWEMRPVYERV